MRSAFVLTWMALAILPASAQDDYTIESLAAIADHHRAQFDSESIRRQGDFARFEVRVTWKDPEQRPTGAPASRVVRFLADCAQGLLALAAVSLYDESGRLLKNAIVPPGSWEYSKPEAGSREARWLQSACG
ncbi:MAG TPA: surface-adhesin E family protein [Burkholderiales bacterium]|jgi:hypothetical protein|nr:surface-adhesin E family protein [Burkholderiales bacterium]